MQENEKKQIKNKIKPRGLFDKNGTDEFYTDVRKETLQWHDAAKIYWQQLYDNHHHLLDNQFVDEFGKECFDRLWELTAVEFIAQHESKGAKLVSLSGKNICKPDFGFDLQRSRFYLETVSAGPGGNTELNFTLDDVSGKARRTPIPEYMERLCNAIDEKADNKYYGKNGGGYKGYMGEASGLIIAISMAKIPFHNQANNFNIDLRCIYGMSPPKIPLLQSQNGAYEMGSLYHEPQPTFEKVTDREKRNIPAPIKIDYFANDEYSHVSAILLSHTGLSFFPSIDQFVDYCHWKGCRNDFILAHNPFAKIKLPVGFFDVSLEVTASVSNRGMDLKFERRSTQSIKSPA